MNLKLIFLPYRHHCRKEQKRRIFFTLLFPLLYCRLYMAGIKNQFIVGLFIEMNHLKFLLEPTTTTTLSISFPIKLIMQQTICAHFS